MNRAYSWINVLSTWSAGLLCALAFGQAAAAVSGAIYTTNSDGTIVNENIYPTKDAVYLTGGPQNKNDPGLSPDGLYYFQVTDPSGAILLSTDDVSCREVVVSGGRVIGVPLTAPPITCTTGFHALGTANDDNGNTPVQLIPYNDTPNPGGVYKAWLTPVANYNNCSGGGSNVTFGFCDSDSKTDNFRIEAGQAEVRACKFNDLTGDDLTANGITSDDTPIPGWTITATGVDDANGNTNQTVIQQTGSDGCVVFFVSQFTTPVTLTEETRTGWNPTWPADGDCTVYGTYSVSGGVVTTCNLKQDDSIEVDFANHQPLSDFITQVSKDASPIYTLTWNIQKSVDPAQINSSGGGTFNYTVTVGHDAGTKWKVTGNIYITSQIDQTGVTVTDAVDDGGTCSVTDANGGLNESLTANVQLVLPYTCTYSSAPNPYATGTNTATVTLSDSSQVTGTAKVDFTNATVVDKCVTVSDTLGGDLGKVCAGTDDNPKLITYSLSPTGTPGTCTTYDNTATFTGVDSAATDSAKASAKLCVGADLTVSKTASPAFKRTFTWGIKKLVDKTLIDKLSGTATFNYTVNVTHDSGTDSNWVAKGKITVTNPNDWEAITFNLSDAVDDGGTCTIDAPGGTGLTVATSSTTSATYTCTYSSTPAAGTNTATATWNSGTYFTPHGTATGTASVNFTGVTPTLVDNCVTVTDPLYTGGTPAGTLGTACNTDASPKSFMYSKTVPVPTDNCTTVNNTATFKTNTSGTTGSSSQSVKVCGPVAGGLTMGFWSNKNGQGIITGQAASGVCPSVTYLRGYAPFQDLSATATCAQVGTYVLNVIKGGGTTCGGATCNAMLKAQMLATALDVYFSDPALGGNKIGAPAPIGGVKVDLTAICQMTDNGGTATCSGKTENASGAFGGATCLSVSGMLSYAASQAAAASASNPLASKWYGDVKATQVLAKDSFDSINNQVAFSCGP